MVTERGLINRQILSRREVLKALGIIGGAAAASTLLPEKWVRPLVEAGVVPAHAQSSICSSPMRFSGCSDGQALWIPEPELSLAIESLGIVSPPCVGVPLSFSFVLKDNAGITVYSSGPYLFLTSNFGDADANVRVLFSHMTGIPYAFFAHWEFADPVDPSVGQMTCDWRYGVPPLP
jgi:hypothetical protein